MRAAHCCGGAVTLTWDWRTIEPTLRRGGVLRRTERILDRRQRRGRPRNRLYRRGSRRRAVRCPDLLRRESGPRLLRPNRAPAGRWHRVADENIAGADGRTRRSGVLSTGSALLRRRVGWTELVVDLAGIGDEAQRRGGWIGRVQRRQRRRRGIVRQQAECRHNGACNESALDERATCKFLLHRNDPLSEASIDCRAIARPIVNKKV